MPPYEQQYRLSQIETEWTRICEGHESATGSKPLWGGLMERYLGAVYRYLVGAVRDEAVAEELFQEFALRFVRGDLGKAKKERGRFRDYVRKVLINLVNDYHRQRKRDGGHLSPEAGRQIASEEVVHDNDVQPEFDDRWREEVLFQTWEALRAAQPNYYEVLRLQAEMPDLPSREMAEQLSSRLDRPLTAANVRKTLQRARERFARLLVDEVAEGLDDPTPDELRIELRQLRLLSYCRLALEARDVEDNESR